MASPLLQTQFYIPPSCPNLAPCLHLIRELDEGLHLGCQFTLIPALANSGKTTLLAEQPHLDSLQVCQVFVLPPYLPEKLGF
jgi:ATP/maltotriose-dependent transcriptional regulator MalT